jgi:hypothetical protein
MRLGLFESILFVRLGWFGSMLACVVFVIPCVSAQNDLSVSRPGQKMPGKMFNALVTLLHPRTS